MLFRSDWVLVPSQSRVGFDAKSTLRDFSGTTSQVAGELSFDLSRPDAEPQGQIRVVAASLDTGNAGRDEEMRGHLETERYGEMRFTLERFAPSAIDAAGGSVEGTGHGAGGVRGGAPPPAQPRAARRQQVDHLRRVLVLALARRDFVADDPQAEVHRDRGALASAPLALRASPPSGG